MDKVRIGVIGLGLMGSSYARQLLAGEISRCELAAVCHRDPAKTAPFAPARPFATADELINSGEVDAVVIATPHYSHTDIGIAVLQRGLHVLVDKPISVHKADAERLLAAHRDPRQVFGTIFNLRTRPYWHRLREMVRSGELGAVRRISWTATAYFRTDAYYNLAPWRGTWAGEGGGVLINQCPHQLDLLQWIFGMPSRVRAFCHFGKYHDIEVEDEATAYLEYPSGATAVFVASTGEAPGSHRVEVACEMGRVVVENHRITFQKNAVPMSEFRRTSPQAIESYPPVTEMVVPAEAEGGNYRAVLQNFVDAVLDGTPLLAPAAEGLASLELANAMVLSSLEDRTVDLPLDAALFEARLKDLGGVRPDNCRKGTDYLTAGASTPVPHPLVPLRWDTLCVETQ